MVLLTFGGVRSCGSAFRPGWDSSEPASPQSALSSALVSRRSLNAAHYLGAVVALVQLISDGRCRRRSRNERLPFKLKTANPLSNMAVLLTNGRGLREL